MAATPAWPPRSLPRLFVDHRLSEGASVALDAGQANYLGNVMRLGEGDDLLIFDGQSGEWLARIASSSKKRMSLTVTRRTRVPEKIPDVWLAFAPVKRAQTDWLVEKATELGASKLIPVITERSIAERVKLERLRTIIVEAAEQCGRTRIPEIAEPMSLKQLLKSCDPARPLYFADEQGGDPVSTALRPGGATFLIGPEGGFTDTERALVRGTAGTIAISLGPRILRAETAALAALAAYMAIAGDWRLIEP